MRIGIMGGSFDPVHNAHLKLAQTAYEELALDEVWFVPAGVSYHKGWALCEAFHRCEMVKRAIAPYPGFVFSDRDVTREGNTYTADTLQLIHAEEAGRELFFLVGADSLLQMENWLRPEIIFSHAVIAVAVRPGSEKEALEEKVAELRRRYQADIRLLPMEATAISSSQIRSLVAEGEDISFLVPEQVSSYIRENRLYQKEKKVVNFEKIRTELEKSLEPSRYQHTLGVADTAAKLAEHYGENRERAYLTGLLHDCAKNLSEEELLHRTRMAHLPVTAAQERAPYLLHAELGAYYARERYQVDDEEVLNAIRYHTTGREAMTMLEKIIYVADYIEPGRDKAPNLATLRSLAYQNLDETVYRIAEDTLSYLETKGGTFDESSVLTRDYYRKESIR